MKYLNHNLEEVFLHLDKAKVYFCKKCDIKLYYNYDGDTFQWFLITKMNSDFITVSSYETTQFTCEEYIIKNIIE